MLLPRLPIEELFPSRVEDVVPGRLVLNKLLARNSSIVVELSIKVTVLVIVDVGLRHSMVPL